MTLMGSNKKTTRTATIEKTATENDPRWQAVIARDKSFDGQFYFSVRTTGVYCRPSCGARQPSPKNVAFHTSCAAAEQAGFRACKRCKPNETSREQQHAAKIAEVCRLIENADGVPKLEQLAEHAGMSLYHFHRLFKAITGLTPKGYAAAHQAKRVRKNLTTMQTVTDAIFESGYNSNSRFYEKSDAMLGMTPTNYRSGGANMDIHVAIADCSLGKVLVGKTQKGVCMISMSNDPEELVEDLQKRFPNATLRRNEAGFEDLVAKVVTFIEEPERGLDLPLDIRGTAFQQRVWQALREIPIGSTMSYSEIAEKIGAPNAVRAVGTACGANHLSLAIPCHRALRSDGTISGYRWGVERKRILLDREAKGSR